MLNLIVWNRTMFIKMDLALNNRQKLMCHKTQPTNQGFLLSINDLLNYIKSEISSLIILNYLLVHYKKN